MAEALVVEAMVVGSLVVEAMVVEALAAEALAVEALEAVRTLKLAGAEDRWIERYAAVHGTKACAACSESREEGD